MNADFDRGFGHANSTSRLRYRFTLELNVQNRQSLAVRKLFKKSRNVVTRLGCIAVGNTQQLVVLVQGVVEQVRPGAPTQQVDQLVAGYSVNPGREWLRCVVRVALVVDGQQYFLHEILDILWHLREAPA